MRNDTCLKINIIKKIIKIMLKILYQLLIIMCFLLILITVFQKITDSNRSIGGYRIFRVITGSMIPEYDIGEVVISKEVNAKNIKVGDDIVYFGEYGDYKGKIIMHKVTAIDKDEEGSLTFHAKGLHSGSVEDPQIKEKQIYGVVKIKSKILTLLYKLATSIYSSFIIITILVFNVFISFRITSKKGIKQINEYSEEDDEEEENDFSDESEENEDLEEYDESEDDELENE